MAIVRPSTIRVSGTPNHSGRCKFGGEYSCSRFDGIPELGQVEYATRGCLMPGCSARQNMIFLDSIRPSGS